jgi:hypothetical protein
VRAEYEPLIAGSRTTDEMRRLLNLMVGELNASHLGAGSPPNAFPPATGRVGLRFDRREYETTGRLRVTEARRSYLNMTLRGLSTTPARTVLGQRALNRPTILVTNQHSLSDAEDFTEGYRTLRLGQVVGEPTSGWIIYTWNQTLIDGTTFRLPRMKITANDGTNMERNTRPVDIESTRPIGETLTDRDSQLDVAVRELLKQLGAQRSTSPR